MKYDEYTVISSHDEAQFESNVERLIKGGWHLVGGVQIIKYKNEQNGWNRQPAILMYAQAMALPRELAAECEKIDQQKYQGEFGKEDEEQVAQKLVSKQEIAKQIADQLEETLLNEGCLEVAEILTLTANALKVRKMEFTGRVFQALADNIANGD